MSVRLPWTLFAALAFASAGCLDIDSVRDRYADAAVALQCSDEVRNGDETGTDCGGGTCPTCGVGEGCGGPSDCASGFCINGLCNTPRCGDGVVTTGEECDSFGVNTPECNADCSLPTCSDGNVNQSESDVDCGGPCPACADGRACDTGTDCVSGACNGSVCLAASCGDGVINGTDVCDDAGASATCDADCTVPDCGDGLVNAAAGEECDDGANVARDGCSASCSIESDITYTFTEQVETYVVPPGVSVVRIEAQGGQGQNTANDSGNGGLGGRASGNLGVSEGDVLYIRVGGMGNPDGVGQEAGTFGGGGGGALCLHGGGASDVRLNGQALNDRVIVAGGGGGASSGNGGTAGGLSGSSGSACSFQANTAGGGGTQTRGGFGGSSNNIDPIPGTLGVGGNCPGLAGSGGGGYYGGGSGGVGCAAGGGSSYIGGVFDASTLSGGGSGNGRVRIIVQ